MKRYAALILILLLAPVTASADDKSDVLDLVERYGDLENDLEAQSSLMHPDRINNWWITSN